MSPYRSKASCERAPRAITPKQRFNRLWFRLALRRLAHLPNGTRRTIAVYTEGVALLVWLWWRCRCMRRVMRVHASLRPYTIQLDGGGTMTRFPDLRAARDAARKPS